MGCLLLLSQLGFPLVVTTCSQTKRLWSSTTPCTLVPWCKGTRQGVGVDAEGSDKPGYTEKDGPAWWGIMSFIYS